MHKCITFRGLILLQKDIIMIRFSFNPEKAVQTVLWALRNKPSLTKHTISKVLFFADRYHLNKYGRPVLGSNYCAMKYGPVPSEIYDMIKDQFCVHSEALGLEKLPFYQHGHHIHIEDDVPDQYDLISESDIEALNFSIENYADIGFSKLTEISHEDLGWKKAWDLCPNSRIDYVDMIDDTEDKDAKLEWFEFNSYRLKM